jgi:hypothetical protein
MKVTIALLLLLLFVPNPVLGQGSVPQSKPTKKAELPQTGKLAGFAFLVTKGGDLKPARLARVIVLYWPKNREVVGEYQLQSENRVRDEVARVTDGGVSVEDTCQVTLTGYYDAVASTLKWASEHGKSDQVKTFDADEEGHFTISGLLAGRYTLIVAGQAGLNHAFWQKDKVLITTGQITLVKLSSPEQACLAQ